MKTRNYRLGLVSSALFIALGATAADQPGRSNISLAEGVPANSGISKTTYIVKLKGESAIAHFIDVNNIPQRLSANSIGIEYDSKSQKTRSVIDTLRSERNAVIRATGIPQPIHTYSHTFNGFAVKLSPKQVEVLKANPDVVGVWPDELMHPDTSNTPKFLGLTEPGGLHLSGVDGDGVIVGVVDTGVNPEHPSFSGEGFTDPSQLDWQGECIHENDPTFSCNNKLIGARYFNAGAKSAGPLASYEIESPRDVDGHGSHTASTAAGNVVNASYQGAEAGVASGMAPKARVAVYKACWDLEDPEKTGCYGSDTMAAIEAAVEDGVDVINYSIGGSLTDLITPASEAFLNASSSGIYVATSAGNSGPTISTVGMPVPWVTNTAAATYEGYSLGDAVLVNTGTLANNIITAAVGDYKPLDSVGITGELAIVEPLDACTEVTNAQAIAGKIALLQRGSCNFTDKIANVTAAGAAAAVVYNSVSGEPIVMAGTPGATISAIMITLENGNQITSDIQSGTPVSMTLSSAYKLPVVEHGNIMADFSSRGPSLAVGDLLVPDITAPGVKILAAAPNGDDFAYLQGTSMASPHIAGIGALLKQVHPDWSPAMIQSAIMTTARQNLLKEDYVNDATPFDMGAGYVVPNKAVDPGLVYNANIYDYLGFICGKADEAGWVPANYNTSCSTFEQYGYLGGADYNQPSITFSELGESRVVLRYVTNVAEQDSTYQIVLDTPDGFNVTTYINGESGFEPSMSLNVPAGETVAYAYQITPTTAAYDEWRFGAVTLSDGLHDVRVPVSVRRVLPPQIEVVSTIELDATDSRPRLSIPVQTNYNGKISVEGHGLAAAIEDVGTVYQDEDGDFTFNEGSLGFNVVPVQPGTKAIQFELKSSQLAEPTMDLDLFVYSCVNGSCSPEGQSATASSDETVTIIDPVPLNDWSTFNGYIVFVLGWNLNGETSTNYTLNTYHAAELESNMNVRMRSAAREGSTSAVSVSLRNLVAGESYFGGLTFRNGEGDEIGFTTIKVNQK